MARTYKRDSNGRFAGGGGGSRGGGSGGGGKARPGQIARATERAKANRKRGEIQGMYGLTKGGMAGRTVMGAQKALKRYGEAPAKSKRGAPAGPRGRKVGSTTQQKKSAAAQAARTAQFSSKAAPNKAKEAYKSARSAMREARMYAGGRTSTKGIAKSRTDAGANNIRAKVAAVKAATKKVQKMEATRGKYKPRRSR